MKIFESINTSALSIISDKVNYSSRQLYWGFRATSSMTLGSPLTIPWLIFAGLVFSLMITSTFSCSFMSNAVSGFKTPFSYIASIILCIIYPLFCPRVSSMIKVNKTKGRCQKEKRKGSVFKQSQIKN